MLIASFASVFFKESMMTYLNQIPLNTVLVLAVALAFYSDFNV